MDPWQPCPSSVCARVRTWCACSLSLSLFLSLSLSLCKLRRENEPGTRQYTRLDNAGATRAEALLHHRGENDPSLRAQSLVFADQKTPGCYLGHGFSWPLERRCVVVAYLRGPLSSRRFGVGVKFEAPRIPAFRRFRRPSPSRSTKRSIDFSCRSSRATLDISRFKGLGIWM